MFTIAKQIEIDMGHRLPFHAGGCRFLHGHRWKIEVEVSAPVLQAPEPSQSNSGMVLDFSIIKAALMDAIHTRFDHRLVLWENDPLADTGILKEALVHAGILEGLVVVPVIPTSEGLAEYWAGLLVDRLAPFSITALRVWETPTSVATWRPDFHSATVANER